MPGRFNAFLSKARDTAVLVGSQAGTAIRDTSSLAASTTQSSLGGLSFTLEAEAARAEHILHAFLSPPPNPYVGKIAVMNRIPREVVARAKGFAVFTVIKAGFMFSGKAGSGLVVARLPDGSWSAPSCIATAGIGWGLQVGADITEFVIVLNNDDAVKAFSQGGNVTIGGNISATAGPVGGGAQVAAAMQHPAPMFSYTSSKGLFAGVSLEGTVLVERKEANRAFYGTAISAHDILSGLVPAPEIANGMYEVIETAEGLDPMLDPGSATPSTVAPGDNETLLHDAAPTAAAAAVGAKS
ncbi:hypothetical protein QFC19_000097 [Naganishia cerealis]|uniref:Uncharacterized protein n=1 Tax=Naganishia cerealis TaxID=610337 RepID=A0ACC2WQ60_9TREE|nr:hypothetical protein QFC19_000097 [Naganishia cerealis]